MTPLVLIKRIVGAIVVTTLALYLVDAASVLIRSRHPKLSDPFESVVVQRILAIPENSGKVSYEQDVQQPTQTVTCVHAIFPHSDASPCWYVHRHPQQPIPMVAFVIARARIADDPNGEMRWARTREGIPAFTHHGLAERGFRLYPTDCGACEALDIGTVTT